MKKLIILLTLFIAAGLPPSSFAQGYAVFPQSHLTDLQLIASNAQTSSFVVQNSRGEQVTGYLDDYLGTEEAMVVKVTNKYVTLEIVEMVVDTDGYQYEQPTRSRIFLSSSLDGHGKGGR